MSTLLTLFKKENKFMQARTKWKGIKAELMMGSSCLAMVNRKNGEALVSKKDVCKKCR